MNQSKMIFLKLKNFRKFTSAEFSFDQHLSLISGKSGQGKTTIFMAIMFALTGEGKKLPTYGKVSCSVTLKLEIGEISITITRTKRPNRLQVLKQEKMLEDKEAQAAIDDMFPQYHIGYMAQRTDSSRSFILMTPLDKMKFIENMAFGSENVDLLVNNCKDLIKKRKNELMLTKQQRETTEKMLTEMKIVKSDLSNIEPMDEKEFQTEFEGHEKELDKLKNRLSKTENLIKLKSDIGHQLSQIPDVAEDLAFIESELNHILTHKREWERYQKEKSKMNKMTNPSSFTKEEIKTMINDMKNIISLENEVIQIEKINSSIVEINKQLNSLMFHMVCPSCETTVAMFGDKLVIPSQTNSAKSPASIETIHGLEERLVKAKLQSKDLEKKLKELEQLKNDYPEVEDAKKHLNKLFKIKSDDEAFLNQKTLCASLKVKKPSYNDDDETKLSQKRKHVFEKKEKEKTLSSIVIKHDIENIKNQIETTNAALIKLNKDKLAFQSFKHWESVEQLSKTEEDLNKSYPRAVKLQEIIKTAEKMAVMRVVDEINLHAQLYLDNFISDVSVMLIFDGIKLNVEVSQNGCESDIQNLSGGELARVILAFTIALAEINNVKLLLLDECVSSLDQESTSQVIDTIKENFSGIVICIAHQTTTGIFDNVLEL
jgi:exonuclease SbcC